MSAATVSNERVERIPTGRILRAGATAAVLAALANTVVRLLAVTLRPVDPGFMPLGWGPPVMFTLIGAIGATLVFWIVSRLSRRPARTFTIVAVVALLLSLIPDLQMLLGSGSEQFPGTSGWTVGALITMHFVAFAIIVPMLNRTAKG